MREYTDDSDEPLELNIRRVIEQKNPALFTALPEFAIKYLERITHITELNNGLRKLHEYRGIAFAREVMEYLDVTVETVGTDNLRSADRPIVVANHPLGGLDGVALISIVGSVFPNVRVPANDILMNLPHLREAFIPVNKHGSNLENLAAFNRAFEFAEALVHFPAGRCSRKKAGRIRDLEWHKSFVAKAREYDRTVVPTFIEGENSGFFYGLSRTRQRFGIKANLEMLYLVDEMFKQRGRRIRVVFGRPIAPSSFARGTSAGTWATRVKRHVYRLGTDPGAVFKTQ